MSEDKMKPTVRVRHIGEKTIEREYSCPTCEKALYAVTDKNDSWGSLGNVCRFCGQKLEVENEE